jgi:hypothetical protein
MCHSSHANHAPHPILARNAASSSRSRRFHLALVHVGHKGSPREKNSMRHAPQFR